MVKEKRRLTINIGSEREFFRELAGQNPNKNYLILDPIFQKKDDGFDNPWFFRWAMDESLSPSLPLESINETINYL